MKREELLSILGRFTGCAIWGLRTDCSNTHRHVHRYLFDTLQKIGYPVFWCDNDPKNNEGVREGDLVISMNLSCHHLQFGRKCYYAVLNVGRSMFGDSPHYLMLRTYGEVEREPTSVDWSPVVSFDKETPMLHQSLATNLLSEEFLPPVFTQSDVVHWVGSIWNDANNHGNIENIGRLEQALAKNHLHFESHKGVSDEENVNLIRASRIAPAIGGGIQVKRHMMPCRVWKNISYGQACVTNLPKALEVFPSGVICNRNIGQLIEQALSVGKEEWIDMAWCQQEIVARDHTYLNWLYNVGRAFSELG